MPALSHPGGSPYSDPSSGEDLLIGPSMVRADPAFGVNPDLTSTVTRTRTKVATGDAHTIPLRRTWRSRVEQHLLAR